MIASIFFIQFYIYYNIIYISVFLRLTILSKNVLHSLFHLIANQILKYLFVDELQNKSFKFKKYEHVLK